MIRHESCTPTAVGADQWVAEAVQRLEQEFRGSLRRDVIINVVRRSRSELDSPSVEALPELLERLARQRLLQRAARA